MPGVGWDASGMLRGDGWELEELEATDDMQ